MRSRKVAVASVAVVALFLALALSAVAQPAPRPVVTIQPPCPVLVPGKKLDVPVQVQVRYDPAAPGARLTEARSLSLELAFNTSNYQDNQRSIAMTRRQDGVWQGTVALGNEWLAFALFYLRDDRGRVDNNGAQYWEIVTCDTDGLPTTGAVNYQAESYTGVMLADGIQRAPDFERAIGILQQWMEQHHSPMTFLSRVWGYRLQQNGRTDAAFRSLAPEIERFVAEHATDESSVAMALSFMLSYRSRFPAGMFGATHAALVKLNPRSPFAKAVLAELAWDRIADEPDARARMQMYEQFIAAYPANRNVQMAYPRSFMVAADELKDVAGVEKTFAKWREVEPASPDAPASTGYFYVEQGIKSDEAVRLLTVAIDLCRAAAAGPSGRNPYVVTVACDPPDPKNPAPGQARLGAAFARLRYWRGQALAQRGDSAAAIDDLRFAARTLDDDPKVAFTLGQVSETAGRKDVAFDAYLEAATAPYQTSREPADALARVFVAGGMGTAEQLDARMAARIDARRKKMAADYKPVPVDRPSPAFEATLLDGAKVSKESLRGRPAVLNFWATWCGPCVAELPGVLDLQRRNPQIAVIALAQDAEIADVRAELEKRRLKDLRAGLAGTAAQAFAVNAVPVTYVLDKDGRIRFAHVGQLGDFVAMIEKELGMIDK